MGGSDSSRQQTADRADYAHMRQKHSCGGGPPDIIPIYVHLPTIYVYVYAYDI